MSFLKQEITLRTLLQNPELLEHPKCSSTDGVQDKIKVKEVNGSRIPFAGQSAFLGQQLWDKTVPYDVTADLTDFKLEYMDLDEFLTENCIPSTEELSQIADVLENSSSRELPCVPNGNVNSDISAEEQPQSQSQFILPVSPSLTEENATSSHQLSPPSPENNTSDSYSQEPDVPFDMNPDDLELARVTGSEAFDPRKRSFTEDELRPQPIIKKSRKIFVPDDCKDDKYWKRRRKNNDAAKRSREARRVKENQITLRAAFLESQNKTLKSELKKMKEDMVQLEKSKNEQIQQMERKKNEEIRNLIQSLG